MNKVSKSPALWLPPCSVSLFWQDRHSVVKRGEGDSPPSTSPDDTNQTFKFSPGDGQALQVLWSSRQQEVSTSKQWTDTNWDYIPSPVSRSPLFQALTHSWLWSTPRVEGGRGSGEWAPGLYSCHHNLLHLLHIHKYHEQMLLIQSTLFI